MYHRSRRPNKVECLYSGKQRHLFSSLNLYCIFNIFIWLGMILIFDPYDNNNNLKGWLLIL